MTDYSATIDDITTGGIEGRVIGMGGASRGLRFVAACIAALGALFLREADGLSRGIDPWIPSRRQR